jgi:hypothetical protein
MRTNEIRLELLPRERAVLLQWNYTPEVRSQLEAVASSRRVETIVITMTDARWLSSDLNHAIVKKGCHDADAFDLSERLDYVAESGDGRLASWR